MKHFQQLYALVKRLRGPKGCPWDQAQTPETLRSSLVEETHECVEAIEREDNANLKEELGDLYLVTTMIAYTMEQEECFSVEDVLRDLCYKLVRRHPHVFHEGKAVQSAQEAKQHWDRIKEEDQGENHRSSSRFFSSFKERLSPLERTRKIQEQSSAVGFDWPSIEGAWEKVHEEIAEVKEAFDHGNAKDKEMELGDLLFAIVNIARFLGVNPALALNRSNQKFVERFQRMEDEIREKKGTLDADTLQNPLLWERAKEGD